MGKNTVRPGRPATGLKRPRQMSIQATNKERDLIKSKAFEKNLSLTDYFLQLIALEESLENKKEIDKKACTL